MWMPLSVVIAVLAAALTGWAGWRAVADRPVIWRQLQAAGVVEAVILVQAIVAVVLATTGDGPANSAVFWGYVAANAFVLPIAGAWSFAERTRWSSVVLLVAAFTVAFLQLRLWQVWTTG